MKLRRGRGTTMLLEVFARCLNIACKDLSHVLVQMRAPKYDATELRTIQDYIVRPILRTVQGVTEINSFGGLVKEYQVIVKPERLTSFHISLREIFDALAKNNANASGNFVEHQSEQYIVRRQS